MVFPFRDFWHRTKGDIYVVSVDTVDSEPLNLVPPGKEVSGLSLSPDGRLLVFSRGAFGGGKDLWKVAVNPQTGKAFGDPLLLVAFEQTLAHR